MNRYLGGSWRPLLLMLPIALGVLLYGAAGSLAATLVTLGIGLAAALLLLATLHNGTFWRPAGVFPLGAFFLLSLLQLVPLPPAILESLAPGLAGLYHQGLWLLVPGRWMPLSCYPEATLEGAAWLLGGILVYLMAAQFRGHDRQLRLVVRTLVVAAGLYSFFSLVQFFLPGDRIFWFLAPWPERTSHHFGSFVNGNHYAALMAMLLPLMVVFSMLGWPAVGYGTWRERLTDILTDPALHRPLLAGFGAFLVFISIAFSLSRGGLISASLAMLLLGVLLATLGGRRVQTLLVPLLLLLVLVATAWLGWEPITHRFGHTFDAAGELTDQRPLYWQDSLEMMADQPLFGSGLGSFEAAYPPYKTALTGPFIVDHAHNDYLELLTDMGGVGGLLWGCFLWSALSSAWRALRQRRRSWTRQVGLALLCGLAAIGMHSVTDFNLRIPAVWLVFCFLFGLLQAVSHSSSQQAPKGPSVSGRPLLAAMCTALLLVLVGGRVALLTGDLDYQRWSQVAIGQLGTEQKSIARSDLESAAFWTPLLSRPHLALANLALAGQDFSDARASYRRALLRDPLNPEYLTRMAGLLESSGQENLSGRLFEAAVRYDPTSAVWKRSYGDWLLRRGRRTDGMQLWGEALALEPSKAREYLVLLADRRARPGELLGLLPENTDVLLTFARSMEKQGELAEAERFYQRLQLSLARAEAPNAWGYLGLADFYWRQQRYDEALAAATEGIQRSQPNAHLYARLGAVYQRMGLIPPAIKAFRQALDLKPDLKWVRKQLAILKGENP